MPAASPVLAELACEPQPVPLVVVGDGMLQVIGTRVFLDSIVYAFQEGESPEGIVECFPTLELADVYQILAYCLRHPQEVMTYLARQEKSAEEFKRRIEKQFGPTGELRARLLARRLSGKRDLGKENDFDSSGSLKGHACDEHNLIGGRREL